MITVTQKAASPKTAQNINSTKTSYISEQSISSDIDDVLGKLLLALTNPIYNNSDRAIAFSMIDRLVRRKIDLGLIGRASYEF